MSTKGPTQDDNVTDFPGHEREGTETNTTDSAADAAPDSGSAQSGSEDYGVASKFREAEIQRQIIFDRAQRDEYEAYAAIRKKSFNNMLITMSATSFVFCVFLFLSFRNPEIYDIDPRTLVTINQAINALMLLTVPFVLGSLGAYARILISDINPDHKSGLIVSSGLMAVFSWISIKSGVLIALVAPHLDKASISQETITTGQSDFYTLALVAIIVGMFATNVYLMISQKVDQLTYRANRGNPK